MNLTCTEFLRAATRAAVGAVATTQVGNLHARVQAGLGVDDAGMTDYSEAYARRRKRSGRATKPRTLTWTGRMMGAIHADIADDGAIISFSDANSLMKAGYTDAQTPWFGFSPHDLEIISEILRGVEQD